MKEELPPETSEGPLETVEDPALDRATDLLVQRALPEVEPPGGMWARFEVRLEAEPLERPGVLTWIRDLLDRLVPDYRVRTALAGACVFLLAYRSLWWDGGGGFLPVTRSNMRWAILDDSFDRVSSEVRWDLMDATFDEVESDLRWNMLDKSFDEYEESLEGNRDASNH